MSVVYYVPVCCKDYDDLEFSIVSLDGRQWQFEAASVEVCCLRLLIDFITFCTYTVIFKKLPYVATLPCETLFAHNFGKGKPIFKQLLLLDSAISLQ